MFQNMSRSFLSTDSLANRISYFHLMLFMVSLPFDLFYSHLILLSFTLHTLIHLNRSVVKPIFTPRTLILQSVFVVTVFSTIYTLKPAVAFNEWGRQFTIFCFPLLFCITQLDIEKSRPRLLMAFALICTATVAYLYMDALVVIRHYHLPLSTLFSVSFTNHNFSEPIGMHATFFSLQAAMALVYLLTVLLKERMFSRKIFYLACIVILTAGLIQLCSKSVFAALLFIVNIAVPYFLLNGAKRWKFAIISASFSVLAIAAVFSSGTFRKRYLDGLRDDLSAVPFYETTDSRLARWETAVELIRKSPVIGYGAGSEIGLLHERFYQKKLYSSYLNNLNAHSEYLSFLIRSGILGLLVYLGTLGYGFYISFRKKDLLFFAFMTLIAIVSISENLLDVDKGIIFYAFFFSLFALSGKRRQRTSIPIKKDHEPYSNTLVTRSKQKLELYDF